MADLSAMSDADLQALHAQLTAPAPTADLSGMSDAELQALHSQLGGVTHPISGPTGDLTVDIPRRLGTGAATAMAGFLSLPNTAAKGIDWLGGLTTGGTQGPWAEKALGSIKAPGSPDPLFPDFQTAKNMAFN